MGDKAQDKVQAFDARFTTNQIQKLKILASYFDASMQKHMAIYIKLMELQYTMQYFQTSTLSSLDSPYHMDMGKLCEEFLPYCDPSERASMEQMINMLHTMDKMKEMMEMAEMIKEMFPEGETPFGADSFTDQAQQAGTGIFPDLSQLSQMMQLAQMFQNSGEAQGGDPENGAEQTPCLDGG